ncbi:MAG: hypothetical protein ACQEXC_09460 [Pseudomonadota bacterium]
MPSFPAIFLALWMLVFVTGWALTAGRMFLDGHWFIAALLTAGFTWMINFGNELAQGMAGDPPQDEDDQNNSGRE